MANWIRVLRHLRWSRRTPRRRSSTGGHERQSFASPLIRGVRQRQTVREAPARQAVPVKIGALNLADFRGQYLPRAFETGSGMLDSRFAKDGQMADTRMKGARSRRARLSTFSGPLSEKARLIIVLTFLVLCALGGGASRDDVLSLLYLRPAAILSIAALFLLPGRLDFASVRIPLLLLAGLAGVILLQLIPLPPDLWLALPGRERFGEAAAAAGFPQPWRPLALSPDFALDSLVSLSVPLAGLVGFAALREDQRFALLPFLIGTACLSAVLGIMQMTGGARSPVFLYDVTHQGAAVGVFANRNHQAALLAMTFPMLSVWTLMPAKSERHRRARLWAAFGIGLFLVPMILVTGSRAGMALGGLGIVAAYLMVPRKRRGEGMSGRWGRMSKIAIWAAPVALSVAVILLGRALAFERLVAVDDIQMEQRLRYTPLMLDIVRDFFPLGTGFGTFDPIFRLYEPDEALNPLYFNRAHNDLIELAITGGVPALIALALFLIWWVRRSILVFLSLRLHSQPMFFARLGALMVLMLFLASLVDYPLRTPLMAVVFAIACGWLSWAPERTSKTPPSG